MTAGWVQTEADEFWSLVGQAPPFPRDLSTVLPVALPLGLVVLPALALHRVEGWLMRRGVPYRFPCQDRRLRGCLVGHAGSGLLFVDGADEVDQRRFTVAHEAAHFLVDYLRLRRDAIDKLGAAIVDVLDGRRAPSREERVDAVLSDCPIGVYVDLLSREEPRHSPVAAVEERADHLACELLAPAIEVERRCDDPYDTEGLALVLHRDFGLPQAPASAYARRLSQSWCPLPSYVDWLRP